MPRHLRWTAALVSLVLLSSGCSLLADDDTGFVPGSAFGLKDALSTRTGAAARDLPPEQAFGLRLRPAQHVRDRAAAYVVGDRTARAPDNDAVVLPARRNAAGLIHALDDEDNVLATGLTVHLDGVERSAMPLDGRSTALSQLLSTPPFLTSDPATILLVAAAAARSPDLEALAAHYDERAAGDPAYLAEPTPQDRRLLTRLVVDTAQRFKQLVTTPTAAGPRNRALPAALAAAADQPVGCVDQKDAFQGVERARQVMSGDAQEAGTCFYTTPSPELRPEQGGEILSATNEAPAWGIVMTAGSTGVSAVQGLVPAASSTFPGPSVLAKVLEDTATAAATSKPLVIASLCRGLGAIGLALQAVDEDCTRPDPAVLKTELDRVTESARLAWDAADLYGTARVLLDADAVQRGFTLMTAHTGRGNAPAHFFEDGNRDHFAVTATQMVAAGMTVWTQVVRPLAELVSNQRARREQKGERVDGVPLRERLGPLYDAAAQANTQSAFTNFLNATASGNWVRTADAAGELARVLLSTPRLRSALVRMGIEMIEERTAMSVLDRWPGRGGVKASGPLLVLDAVAVTATYAISLDNLHSRLDDYADLGAFLLHVEPARVHPDVRACADPSCDDRRTTPKQLVLAGDGSLAVSGVVWSSWDPDTAIGRGTLTRRIFDGGASNSTTETPVVVELSAPADGLYRTLTLRADDGPADEFPHPIDATVLVPNAAPAPATPPVSTDADVKVYTLSYDGFEAVGAQVRPAEITWDGDAGTGGIDLVWSSWGATSAEATGRQFSTAPTSNVSAGQRYYAPIRLRLTTPVVGQSEDIKVFTVAEVTYANGQVRSIPLGFFNPCANGTCD